MKDPLPKLSLQHMTTELYDEASAMKNSLEQVTPSKKKSRASHGVGAGVIISSLGEGVGAGVSIDVGAIVLQVSMKSHVPLSMDPLPKFTLQHSIADPYDIPPKRKMSLVHTLSMKKNR